MVPVFTRDPAAALRAAHHADVVGIDGVFSYDHLFPIMNPDRPALAALPTLAAIAAQTERLRVGTLVSRVTLMPVPVLVEALVTLDEISGGRAIAGIGTGDRMTEAENVAYGMPFPPLRVRLDLLIQTARALRSQHVHTWIGGRSREVRAIAAAEADGWNSWDGPLEELKAFAAANEGSSEATWGGPPPPDGDLAEHLRLLAGAHVQWAIYGPPMSVDWEGFVAKLAGAAKSVR
ncbi:MAG TPA: LLM class flavin-dependent oxidoreductase [Acidimicrobiales bacterium]|nr:LLM class flavin-dependent oxidoreductase [Acidimicrobiales bacterium]